MNSSGRTAGWLKVSELRYEMGSFSKRVLYCRNFPHNSDHMATSQRVKVNPRDTIVSLSTKTCDSQGAFLLLCWGLKVPSVTCQEFKKAQFPLTLCNKVNVHTKILTSMFSPITNLDSNYVLKLKIFFKI